MSNSSPSSPQRATLELAITALKLNEASTGQAKQKIVLRFKLGEKWSSLLRYEYSSMSLKDIDHVIAPVLIGTYVLITMHVFVVWFG